MSNYNAMAGADEAPFNDLSEKLHEIKLEHVPHGINWIISRVLSGITSAITQIVGSFVEIFKIGLFALPKIPVEIDGKKFVIELSDTTVNNVEFGGKTYCELSSIAVTTAAS